ncbi:MAG: tRNA (adenosine(37)-N6)-dimethylallyltransferase MiaA [Saccharofermentans sp.]|nr:tRNA (adenosine(37)-N6)-dimethylallyltransferase MiaA [Saccharofermentans sp.]
MIDPGPYLKKYAYIPIVTGPTASGKSAVALELCRMCGGELISADSMQIYKGLDVGTAKDSRDERSEIPHHLTDIIEPGEDFSVFDYVNRAKDAISDILGRGRLPVICGGTGQYISALLFGIDYGEEDDDECREAEEYYYGVLEKEGKDTLYKLLTESDPEAASNIHPNNVRRVVRALAVRRATGVSFSEKNKRSKREGPAFSFKTFMPEIDRAVLYDRINRRVDLMIEQGLEEEARMLYQNEKARGTTCFQAIGYKEFEKYFSGEEDLNGTSERIKLGSRHYAKRQLTWFRHMGIDIETIPSGTVSSQCEFIIERCRLSKFN